MGYAIDPELQPVLELLPQGDLRDIEQARGRMAAMITTMNGAVDTAGVAITDHEAPGIGEAPAVPVRLYMPDAPAPAAGRPALLDIHGGAFVTGSQEMEHAFATSTARDLGIVVAVVEYRLAPEHPFPAALDDCYGALCWLHDQANVLGVDPTRVGVGGQSSGGGLSAAVSLLARDRGGPPLCFQLLGMPELDHRLETVSMRSFTDTPLFNRASAEASWASYLPGDTVDGSPYASPATADDLRGLPPTYIATMEFDPLRDEGIAYGLRLLQAGVPVELHNFPGTFHGAAALPSTVSQRINDELLVALRRGLRIDV